MSRVVRTESGLPGDRGREFGAACAERIAAAVEGYRRLFEAGGATGPSEIAEWGEQGLAATAAWAPPLAEEIEGVAAGAGLAVAEVAALNARTEILAKVARHRRGECSTLVSLDPGGGDPVAAQTWDWHEELTGCWLVWELRDQRSGIGAVTLTEAGILGKIGVNSAGLAVLLNVLHHDADGEGPIRVPIHALLRRVLTEAGDAFEALQLISSAPLSASSALTLIAAEDGESTALTAELRPAARPAYLLPDQSGLLIHTNHFLDESGRPGDREPTIGPDSLFRLDLLRRRAARMPRASVDDLAAVLSNHLGGGGALCCHPGPGAETGDRYTTLATVTVEPAARRLRFAAGGPCEAGAGDWTELEATPIDPNPKEDHVRPH